MRFRIKNMEQKSEGDYNKELLYKKYQKNIDYVKEAFTYPTNKDLVVREIMIKSLNKKATLFYIDVACDVSVILQHIIHPLSEDIKEYQNVDEVVDNLIHVKSSKQVDYLDDVIDDILKGYTIIIIEDYARAFSIDTIKFESRGVEVPKRENVIRGPQESFSENIQLNLSLIRKYIKSRNLITEKITLGKTSLSTINILYLKDIIDPKFLEDLKNRINSLNVDTVAVLETLDQMIEEKPYSLIPNTLYTEKPDRAAAFLNEGHFVVLLDNSSSCLIGPVTFWALLHTPEDMYQRWAYGNLIRLIRFIALLFALLTPSIYIALTTFHIGMVPTDLLLAIAATRERVPFPVIIEILLMEISFELLREAGIRIPTPIGPTIGIVGALILGQAAVQANIVSPILVIVVALTGLSSFAIQNNSLNYAIRILRFPLLILSSILGFFGLAVGLIITLAHASTFESFGVPFFTPVTPYKKSNRDLISRPPFWKTLLRPTHLNPRDKIRRKPPVNKKGQ